MQKIRLGEVYEHKEIFPIIKTRCILCETLSVASRGLRYVPSPANTVNVHTVCQYDNIKK